METGTPYILFKDAANKKSDQKNMGMIKGSNLCTEIMEYSDANETVVCNLASTCSGSRSKHSRKEWNLLQEAAAAPLHITGRSLTN